MIPFGDLFNYGSSENTNVSYTYSEGRDAMIYRATKDIKRGDQLFESSSYGSNRPSNYYF